MAAACQGAHLQQYSQFANIKYTPLMNLKPQDLLVLLKVAAHPPQHWTYAVLGEALAMSASEAHACVKRAVACGLAVEPARGEWSPVKPNLLEFMVHGVRYIWPATPGPVKRGVPTAFGAEPLASHLAVAAGEAPKNRTFRVGGMVKEGSVERKDLTVKFIVTDTAKEMTVTYTGILPDLFREGKGVVAQGKLGDNGLFTATEVLAKHDENYMPPEAQHAVDQAQKTIETLK